MLEKLNNTIFPRKKIEFSPITNIDNETISCQSNRGRKLKKLPFIKKIIQKPKLLLSHNNEFIIAETNLFKKRLKKIKFIPHDVHSKTTKSINKINYMRNSRLKKIEFETLKSSSSLNVLYPKTFSLIRNFHSTLMYENKKKCIKNLIQEYNKYDNEKNKEFIKNELSEKKNDDKIKTGIYGKNDNIIGVILSRMQRLKLDNEYKKTKPEVRNLIKDEIMDAEVRLNRKPKQTVKIKDANITDTQKHLLKYKYFTKRNDIIGLNQNLSIPNLIKDGPAMMNLIKDAFQYYKIY